MKVELKSTCLATGCIRCRIKKSLYSCNGFISFN